MFEFSKFFQIRLLPFDDTKTVHGNVRHMMQNEGSGCEGKNGYFDCIPFYDMEILLQKQGSRDELEKEDEKRT